jgi:hypothetical protein
MFLCGGFGVDGEKVQRFFQNRCVLIISGDIAPELQASRYNLFQKMACDTPVVPALCRRNVFMWRLWSGFGKGTAVFQNRCVLIISGDIAPELQASYYKPLPKDGM